MIEVVCLAFAIWFECRGCSAVEDRVAVANVVMNRKYDTTGEFRRRHSTCAVIHQPGHFPWQGKEPVIENVVDEASWQHVYQLAYYVYNGYIEDLTDGAKWFHTVDTPQQEWTRELVQVDVVGSNVHIFFKREETNE